MKKALAILLAAVQSVEKPCTTPPERVKIGVKFGVGQWKSGEETHGESQS